MKENDIFKESRTFNLTGEGLVDLAYPVTVVGIGPGSREHLTPAAGAAVAGAEVLVGGQRALALFAASGKECRRIDRNLEEVLDFIEAARQERRVAVLLSGDPGFFSLLPRLRARFGEANLRVVPGISCLQLACARLGLNWEDLYCVSVHGREAGELARACRFDRVAVLTDPRFPPAAVCRYFLVQGKRFRQVWVLTDLGLPGEVVTSTSLEEGAQLPGRGNSVVILLQEAVPQGPGAGEAVRPEPGPDGNLLQEPGTDEAGPMVTPGLPDELFVRGEVAMSQAEVRALTLCKAQLKRGMVVYEIGAGTGSWTVEAARLIAPGRVFAVERDPAAQALIRANLEKFRVPNAVLVAGEAPGACTGFPPADCVLIGGSGGRLPEILAAARGWLREEGTLVLTAVTPETFSTAWQVLHEGGWRDQEAVLVNLARVAYRGRARIWQGENPVFILRARRAYP
ncbi:MAG: precorrin-6y C5,15-methyltransferase (decarboxylating) subunit CbiE [Bacillota bacterium]|jgi:precorrin-6Y C5,15-methyltransferase (decarboxylating)|nr:precorrin-6y C5,15-methyltransferase (decarboxylating) subunit CbiE [Bacillota bacterium]